MTRQHYTLATSLLLAVLAMLGGQAVSASAEKRPNILFFLTDARDPRFPPAPFG